MTLTKKYILGTSAALVTALAVTASGFTLAGKTFTLPAGAPETGPEIATKAPKVEKIDQPASVLMGTAPQTPEEGQGDPEAAKKLVEVVDAVNMRAGPSSANRVIKVQLVGTRLQVRGRDGSWVQVVEPASGTVGWIYKNFVKPVTPASRLADSGVTRIQ